MLRAIGKIPEADWRRTFNLGAGMILVIPPERVNSALRTLKRTGEKPWIIGEVIQQRRGKGRVEYR
jgi:phosphoribosylformylglycinamidine cyclo-ligase